MTRDYSQFFPLKSPRSSTESTHPPLIELGWQAFFAQQIDVEALVSTPPVRVIEVHRNALHVLGDGLDTSLPPREDVTVGDWLLYHPDAPQDSTLLDRKSLLKRKAPGTDRNVQLIAANVDTAFIVTSCNQDFNIARLERYVALVFDSGASAVILLTKPDLADDPQSYATEAQSISELVPVVVLDARGDAPRTKLAQWCKPGKTVAFLGSSGVGKSTLTNALAGADFIETQAIREDDARGRHTTTRRQLYHVPGGCLVLDTPGMRELQMTDVAAGIDDVFTDLHQLSHHCRFKDCRHEVEPGCAILQAVEQGDIDATRFARWRKLKAEDAFNSASLKERKSKGKALGKIIRQMQRANKK